MDNKLLIVGIDPGTTLGYAVLDVNGDPIKIKSSKHMNLNSLISEVVGLGKVVVVGTDKAKVPALVNVFSVKTGGRMIRPDEDLKITEKKKLIAGYKARDDHEADALASALFAYKKIESLLKKIDVFVNGNKKFEIRDRIIELVLTRNISITHAIDLIEKPKREEVKIIKKVVEERKLSKADFLRVYDKLKRCEREILFLRKQNESLSEQLKNTHELLNKYQDMAKKRDKLGVNRKLEELINFKEKRIMFFDSKIKLSGKEIGLLKEKINKLNFMLSNLNKSHLVKKLDNLGYAEFEDKRRLLNIEEGDILLVDDPNIFNSKVIEKLKNKVRVIIHKKKLNEVMKKLPFCFIEHKNLGLTETEFFAIVGKEALNRELDRTSVLSKIVEEYKRERATNLCR
jgi:hypothetical protein